MFNSEINKISLLTIFFSANIIDNETKTCIIGLQQFSTFEFYEEGKGCSRYVSDNEDFEQLLVESKAVNIVKEQSAKDFRKKWLPSKNM